VVCKSNHVVCLDRAYLGNIFCIHFELDLLHVKQLLRLNLTPEILFPRF
jgi:hypothetical protein